MNISSTLKKALWTLVIMMFAFGTQAATVVLDEADFMRGTEARLFPFEIQETGNFTATLTDLKFLAPFEVLALVILKGTDVVGQPLAGPGMFNFQADPGNFSANLLGVAGGDSDLSLFRVEVSAVPIPAPALLFASGLAALIAFRRQRVRS
jgi:hypothetical protein